MFKRITRPASIIMILVAGLWHGASLAQQDHSGAGHDHGSDSAQSSQSGQMNGSGSGHGNGNMMQMGEGERGGGMMMRMHEQMMQGNKPMGQDVLAVIRDVVEQLQSDANTDWSQVNIEALRQHLVDMDRVAVHAVTESREIDGGAEYVVSGDDDRTIAAIQRMVPAHALQIQSELGWQAETEMNENGVLLRVSTADESEVAMIRGLGFAGFMVLGEHHESHHLMMAGGKPADHGSMSHDSGGH